jgi:hypothetical protein
MHRNRTRDIRLYCFLKTEIPHSTASITTITKVGKSETKPLPLPSRLCYSHRTAPPPSLRALRLENNILSPNHPNAVQHAPPPNGDFLPASPLRPHGLIRNPQNLTLHPFPFQFSSLCQPTQREPNHLPKSLLSYSTTR